MRHPAARLDGRAASARNWRMPSASRHDAAVAALDAYKPKTVLEVGCGHGVAVRLLLERPGIVRVTALDRSAKMIAAVAASAPEALASGRLALRAEPLEAADFGGEWFDAIIAVNVDFNLRLGERWPGLLKSLLQPGGVIALAFEPPPGSGKGEAFASLSRQRLEAAGLAVGIEKAVGNVTVILAR